MSRAMSEFIKPNGCVAIEETLYFEDGEEVDEFFEAADVTFYCQEHRDQEIPQGDGSQGCPVCGRKLA